MSTSPRPGVVGAGFVDELPVVVRSGYERSNGGVHAMLPRQHACGGSDRGLDGPLFVSRRRRTMVVDALEGIQPATGVLFECSTVLRGSRLPTTEPVGVLEAPVRVRQLPERLNDAFELGKAARVLLESVGWQLPMVSNEQPSMPRLERKGKIKAVCFARLFDDRPVEGQR